MDTQQAPVRAAATSHGGKCRNCGAPLSGPYCAKCGQKDEPLETSFGTLVADFIGSVLNWDGATLSTLRALLVRPGHLTAEWSAGRRARYLPPMRLYFIASVLFLGSVSIFGDSITVSFSSPARAPQAAAGDSVSIAVMQTGSAAPFGLGERLERGRERLNSDPDWAKQRWFSNFAWTMFLAMPVFALLLSGLEWKRRRAYVHHLVFAVHIHAFGFIVGAALAALSAGPDWIAAGAALALLFFMPLYLIAALYVAYGRGFLRTVAESAVLGVLHLLVVTALSLVAMFVTLAIAGSA